MSGPLWVPYVESARIRNATVSAVAASTVTLDLDGATVAGVPVYGPMPGTGDPVIVVEQGGSLLVLTVGGSTKDQQDQIDALTVRVEALERW